MRNNPLAFLGVVDKLYIRDTSFHMLGLRNNSLMTWVTRRHCAIICNTPTSQPLDNGAFILGLLHFRYIGIG